MGKTYRSNDSYSSKKNNHACREDKRNKKKGKKLSGAPAHSVATGRKSQRAETYGEW